MNRVLILAGSHREARNYARTRRLRPAEWKWPGRFSDIQGYERWSEIVELDGYHARRDRFAVDGVVRRIQRKYPGLEVTKPALIETKSGGSDESVRVDYEPAQWNAWRLAGKETP